MRKKWKRPLALLLSGLMMLSPIPGASAQAAASDGEDEATEEAGRVELSFNNDWRFYRGEAMNGEKADYDDSEWLYVNTPHSTIQYTPENYYQEDLGVFWYRRHFETPDTVTDGRQALVTFEGAMQAAEVWLNGEEIGTHQGGYTEFSFDITDELKTDGTENVLAVRLDTRPNAAFAPGKNNPDFQYFGGLYRNVSLTVTDPVHITDAVSSGTVAGGGVFLTAPAVTKESATVKAKTEVENAGTEAADVTVLTEVIDEDGQTVAAKAEDTQNVEAGEKHSFEQTMTVANPRLWSTDTPELYTVRTTVKQGDASCDMVETTYGIRKVEWKRDGCYINDERVDLIGTNLHSEIYMLGNAVSDDAVFEEIKRVKEYGFNFVRMSHYPHSDAFYAACDKYGVAVLDCLAGWQNYANTDAFNNNCYQQMREMVRANRNHASIVAWEPSLNESVYNENWARTINQVTKDEYPEDGVSKAYTGGWKFWNVYDIGVGTPQANVTEDAAKYPDKPIVVSEYGDWNMGGFNSSTRITREPESVSGKDVKGGDEGMLIQCDNIQSSYAFNKRNRDWAGAAAYWQYADYAGFDTEKLTYCGVVDVARIPKFGAYFYQSQRDPEVDLSKYGLESGPMIYIANTWAADSPDQVRVYSNCDEVALYLDDTLIAKQTPDTTMWDPRGSYGDNNGSGYPGADTGREVSTEELDHPPFTFDLSDYTPGEGTLRAVGYLDGEEQEEYVRKAPGEASQITLEAENEEALRLDGSTAKLVWVDVKDADGTVVNTAVNDITFETEGPGFVIGEKTVPVRGGQWAVWVRSKRGSGDITLKATSDGLTEAEIVIPTEEVAGLPEVPEGGDADETGFVQPAPPENIFLKKPITASSENKPGTKPVEAASYANDGDSGTKWCAKVTNSADASVGPHWLQVDLGMEYTVDTVEIDFEQAAGYKYQVAISNDPEFTGYNVNDHEIKTEENARGVEVLQQKGRYVRIYVNCPSSSAWPCVYEIRATGSVNNVALNKTVTVPGTENGSNAKWAVDGDVSTFWSRGAYGPGWLIVDLEGEYHIDDVSVSFAWAGTADNGIIRHKFDLESSMDGDVWEKVGSFSDYDQTDDIVNATVTLKANTEARYLRVNNLTAKKQDGGANQWVEIAEIVAIGEELEETVRMDYNAEAFATSCAEGVTAENGNDGNPQTFWIPEADDKAPAWWYDAAGIYDANLVTLVWNTEGEHKYSVEISTDGENWNTVADHMETGKAGGTTIDKISGKVRYLRVSVEAGTTDGFWINSTGRAPEEKLKVEAVETLAQIQAEEGTLFAELGLPEEVEVTLTGDLITTLPVTWDEESYDAAELEVQAVTGVLGEVDNVVNEDELKASIEVLLTEGGTPVPTLERITVEPPTKTEYEIGEKLDLTGMVVTAHYSDDTTKTVEVSEKNVTGFDSETAGEKTITVTYEGKTATFKVTVEEESIPENLEEALKQAKEAAEKAKAAQDAAEKAVTDAQEQVTEAEAKVTAAQKEAEKAKEEAKKAKEEAEAALEAQEKAVKAAEEAEELAGDTAADRAAVEKAKEAAEDAKKAATGAQTKAEDAREAAEEAQTAAETARGEAVKAKEAAEMAQTNAETAKTAAEEAAKAAGQSAENALQAKEDALAAQAEAEAAQEAAVAEAAEAKKANEAAGTAKTAAEAAAGKAEIAQKLAEAQAQVAVKAADESKAYAQKAEAAKKAAEEAAKRAEEERKKVEEELKKVQEEAEKQLAEMQKLLEETAKATLQNCLDFQAGSWYEDYVVDVYLRGYMTGMKSDYFGINETLVRAQFAVILHRMAGEPEVEFKDKFADVKDGQFYSDAVTWASEEGIITGYENSGLFGPNDKITREQMATIMYRYAEVEEKEEKEKNTDEILKSFADAEKVSEFAKEALAWCVEEGIITGDNGNLNPGGYANRAETAAIIQRAIPVLEAK